MVVDRTPIPSGCRLVFSKLTDIIIMEGRYDMPASCRFLKIIESGLAQLRSGPVRSDPVQSDHQSTSVVKSSQGGLCKSSRQCYSPTGRFFAAAPSSVPYRTGSYSYDLISSPPLEWKATTNETEPNQRPLSVWFGPGIAWHGSSPEQENTICLQTGGKTNGQSSSTHSPLSSRVESSDVRGVNGSASNRAPVT